MWNRLRWQLQSLMFGRNGLDELGRITIYCAVGFDIIAMILGIWFPLPARIIVVISYVLLALFIYRCFSKDIQKRRQENDIFKGLFSLWKMKIAQGKEYKIFRCKGCGRNIRVPRGKGKIEVRCPVCGERTLHRT